MLALEQSAESDLSTPVRGGRGGASSDRSDPPLTTGLHVVGRTQNDVIGAGQAQRLG